MSTFHEVLRSAEALGLLGPRAYLAPEGKRADLHVVAHEPQSGAFHKNHGAGEDDPITKMDPAAEVSQRVGLRRASNILSRRDASDLDVRIATALAWAGRAVVEHRGDQSFLLLAISLEALLCKPSSRGGVSERLRLRATHLVGRTRADKTRLYRRIRRLYELRSSLVHSGSAEDLSDSDLEDMRTLTYRAITIALADSRFVSMKSAGEFEGWLDAQLLQ